MKSGARERESVWDYPRPPRLERCKRRVRVLAGEELIAESSVALRILETSHPPAIYIPPADIRMELLEPVRGTSFCEWKGNASYFDVVAPGGRIAKAGWTYTRPADPYAALADHVSFYPSLVECFLDDEHVEPQAGGFYGGWITAEIEGPFKGEPGTFGW